jgi:DNA polymerase-3 subunit beta
MRSDPETDTLLLEQGRRKYKIPTYPPKWFEHFTPFPEQGIVSWSGEFLRELIDRTSFCIADDKEENMHYLKFTPLKDGQTIEVCALNGFRCAIHKFQHDKIASLMDEQEFLIAKPYILELKKWLTHHNVYFALSDNRLFFTNSTKNEQLSLPINFDTFPDYGAFLTYFDSPLNPMTLDKEELLDSLERISIFNTETERCAFFTFDDQELIIYSQAHDTGEATETLQIQYQGDLDKIIFPTRNVIEVLNHFKSQQLSFEFTSEKGPCKISGPEDQDYMVIIMPVTIEQEVYYTEEYSEE